MVAIDCLQHDDQCNLMLCWVIVCDSSDVKNRRTRILHVLFTQCDCALFFSLITTVTLHSIFRKMEKASSVPVVEKPKSFVEQYKERARQVYRESERKDDIYEHQDLKQYGLFDYYMPDHPSLDAAVKAIEDHMLADARFGAYVFNFTSPKHVFATCGETTLRGTVSTRLVERFPSWPIVLETAPDAIRKKFVKRATTHMVERFKERNSEFMNNGTYRISTTDEWSIRIVLE